MNDEQPLTVDMLYLDAEHFVLTTKSGPPLEPKPRVVPIGRLFQGFMPHDDGERPAGSEEKSS